MNLNDHEFIKQPIDKDKVYSIWLSILSKIEQSTIHTGTTEKDYRDASENSMDIGYRLFPLIDSISLNLLGSLSGRKYLKKLGYSSMESDMIYSMFRNGFLHGINPYRFKFTDGEISWGLSSSSGSGGFTPHFPGYTDELNPEHNLPADKAFSYIKLDEGLFHASLSLDNLVAHIKYDLTERQKTDNRKTINFVIGQKINQKTPRIK